ncbi:MAG: TRAM domain-containing protein [Elusimicrobiota bacterium]|jgi:uncharacterized protein YacL|nr:TRAM domain-containing protein [Elusimicrobiota bacterium]
MPLWIFRLSALMGLPFLVYIFVAQDLYSLALAFLCGLVVVLAEYFVRSVKLVSIMIAIFGALCGYAMYMLFDYIVLKMGIPDVDLYWAMHKTIAAGSLTVLAGFLSILKASEIEGLSKRGSQNKIVDMSAIIDGRIVDLCETGFLTGVLVIPQFVIEKLTALASSKDLMEKARGRRGLDIVSRLKEIKAVPVKTTTKDFKAVGDIDRVVALASHFDGEIVTIDFNVNKAAVIKDVPVLNISDLTTALKPVVLPGESMSIFIMKEGKEQEQGIGYLDDGTMVVVEGARRHIGKRAEVAVHSILQTSSGRMIFAKVKHE